MNGLLAALLLWPALAAAGPQVPEASGAPAEKKTREDAKIRVAFFGDSALGPQGRAVLKLAKSGGADAIFHLGDFDYRHSPKKFAQMLDDTIGTLPFFGALGNHEVDSKDKAENKRLRKEYSEMLAARVPGGADCTGEAGVQQRCRYKGLLAVLVTPDILMSQSSHAKFIRSELAAGAERWKICAWHKPHSKIQAGDNGDGPGWDVYEACREQGALIATAHEHGYSRTFNLDSFPPKEPAAAPKKSDPLILEPGRTFTFVSGAGGAKVRRMVIKGGSAGKGWQAAVYMRAEKGDEDGKDDNDRTIEAGNKAAGALFCDFGSPTAEKAECWFKDIDGSEIDRFTVESRL